MTIWVKAKRIPNRGARRLGLLAAALGAGLCAATPLSTARADEHDPAFGYWLTESKRAIVRINACEGAPDVACGSIVWLLEPNDSTGMPRTDANNPESALRSRQLCGLALVGDFKRVKPGSWEDGFIYDPVEGDTYSAWMEAEGPQTLRVRGYVGVSILGSTQVWTREGSDRGGC